MAKPVRWLLLAASAGALVASAGRPESAERCSEGSGRCAVEAKDQASLLQLQQPPAKPRAPPAPVSLPVSDAKCHADREDYRDPEYNSTCKEWDGWVCAASPVWINTNDYDYTHILECACPHACRTCSDYHKTCDDVTACMDSTTYRDPEYKSSCAEWDGWVCQSSPPWVANGNSDYTHTLECLCPHACRYCGFVETCDAHPPWYDNCDDSASYEDPEYHRRCSEWEGKECKPSDAWLATGHEDYTLDLSCNCVKACKYCNHLYTCQY
mmetsp:Transcript_68918/g.177599  ORF Transcript_68918/g.177599 Transcript_68918/m.177599 type:complete len:268 (-) Transcript_68918:67-870(-)